MVILLTKVVDVHDSQAILMVAVMANGVIHVLSGEN